MKLHFTSLTFLIKGQYVHFPNLVHTVGFGVILSSDSGGYLSVAFASVSLRLGNLLKPTIGLLLNWFPLFQFLWMMSLMFGLQGL